MFHVKHTKPPGGRTSGESEKGMRETNMFRTLKCSDGTIKTFTVMTSGVVSVDIHFKDCTKWNVYLGNIDDKECKNSLPRYHQFCFESGKHYMVGR